MTEEEISHLVPARIGEIALEEDFYIKDNGELRKCVLTVKHLDEDAEHIEHYRQWLRKHDKEGTLFKKKS